MQKKIYTTFLLVMTFAILVFSAERTMAGYEIDTGRQGNFEVSVTISIALCSDGLGATCTTFHYDITQLPDTQNSASHFDLIIEKPHANLIVSGSGSGLDCDGSGDPSTGYAKYQTWNCFYKWDDTSNMFLELEGEVDAAPTDWFVKAGADPINYDWGNAAGETYKVTVYKDKTTGEIISILRTNPDGSIDDLTGSGKPIGDFSVCYPVDKDGNSIDCNNESNWEPLKFITDQITTKTGDDSTCAYWYNGYYYNFCGY